MSESTSPASPLPKHHAADDLEVERQERSRPARHEEKRRPAATVKEHANAGQGDGERRDTGARLYKTRRYLAEHGASRAGLEQCDMRHPAAEGALLRPSAGHDWP